MDYEEDEADIFQHVTGLNLRIGQVVDTRGVPIFEGVAKMITLLPSLQTLTISGEADVHEHDFMAVYAALIVANLSFNVPVWKLSLTWNRPILRAGGAFLFIQPTMCALKNEDEDIPGSALSKITSIYLSGDFAITPSATIFHCPSWTCLQGTP